MTTNPAGSDRSEGKTPTEPGKQPVGGISAIRVLVPALLIMLVLHTLIIFNTLRINRMGGQISATTQNTFTFNQTTKQLERTSDNLTDAARLYVGTGDETYIRQYFEQENTLTELDGTLQELALPLGSTDAYEQVAEAVRIIRERSETDLQAIMLAASVYGTDLSPWPAFAEFTLPGALAGLSDDDKLDKASELLGDLPYLNSRNHSDGAIDEAISLFAVDTGRRIGELQGVMAGYQSLQWTFTLTVISVILLLCILMVVFMVVPIRRGVDMVERGDAIPVNRGFKELRLLSRSYNDLLYHRMELENNLRRQSQTDALTDLPNRLAFENYIARLNWKDSEESLTVFSMDVNGLKERNDTEGHSSGDELLQEASRCILSVFGDDSGKNCFRFGGDEFAAFWTGKSEAEVREAVERFDRLQEKHGVSISVGYAYAPKLSTARVETLFEVADKRMYEDKMRRKQEHPELFAAGR